MPKATAALTAERVEQLQRMVLKGTTTAECLAYAGQTWGIRRSQGYALLKRAWQQIKLDIDETGIDRPQLLSWSIQTLMAAAGQAMHQKNPGAVVACIRQLDHMTGTGYNSHRGHVGLFHRIIRCTKVHGLVDESLSSGAGAHGLVAHLRTT